MEPQGPRAPSVNAWMLTPYWDGFVVAVLALMAGLGFVVEDGWRPWATAVLLGMIAACYMVGGRRAVNDVGPGAESGPWWSAVYTALFIPAAVLIPAVTSALLALTPLAYMTMASRKASAYVAVMLMVPPVVGWVIEPSGADALAAVLLAHAAILLFAMWFGGWIDRIVEQSAERAALIRELEASRGRVAALSARSGAQAERERLAREIHDTLAQGFTSVIALVQAVESEMGGDPDAARRHLALLKETGRENLAEARALVAGGAAHGSAGTLEEALRRAADRLREATGAAAGFAVRGAPERELPADVQVDLLRAAQESMANVRRHASAASVRVVLEYGPDSAQVTVADDGRGFDPALPPGFGLTGLRRRAEAAGGHCAIESARGAGTTVVFRVPAPGDGGAA